MSVFNKVLNGRNILPVTTLATTITCVATVLLLPEISLAGTTAPTGTGGLEGVATQIYTLLDGPVALLVSLVGAASTIVGISGIAGFRAPLIAGGAGVAITAQAAPSAMIALSGGGIF